MKRLLYIVIVMSFCISCEKLDPRDEILKQREGTYYLVDAVWAGAEIDLNSDGFYSTDLISELKKPMDILFLKIHLSYIFLIVGDSMKVRLLLFFQY